MADRQRLTEKMVRAAERRGRYYQLFDSEVVAFALAVQPSGTKTFVLNYRVSGRQRRYTIGRWPDWTVVAARERAKELRREMEAGRDPLSSREETREAPRISTLVARYIEEHVPTLSERNGADQVSMMRRFVEPEWKNRLVEEITPADVERLLTKIAEGRARPAKKKTTRKREKPLKPSTPTPVRANRVGEVLRKMFNLAIKWKMREDNPAAGFRRRPETEREVFLSLEEIGRLGAALEAAEDQRAAGIIRLCMLTGARLGEVRQARFEQFNLDYAVWTKQAAITKQRKVHRVPISPDAVSLIRLRREAVPAGCPWLFPSDVEGQPVQEIRKFWYAIQEEAKLPKLRIHDLRHTFASLLASGGASLSMIGKLLGHTQAKTTQRYAHLAEQPLRDGVGFVAEAMRPRPHLVHAAE
ncbi:tyrosine-type recombinase/integrase [Tropicimonas isoalkanivorans]|uniref:Site-specific recombinase XerD n=1 Tax=Tropicimonas isoalkanivorans TaxID=441112 RepID=A0A1I1R515_9RHOB|nr:site-specific integrase [Tropicimonas isoalkanivorans]SFD29484.1 Site-specific recombinase XerD [Tropicimonas isoalkanivorans]